MYYVLTRSKDITTIKEVEPVKAFENLLDATNELNIIMIKDFCKKINKLKPVGDFNPIDIYKETFKFKEFEDIIYIRLKDYDYFIDVYEDIPAYESEESEKLDSDTETI